MVTKGIVMKLCSLFKYLFFFLSLINFLAAASLSDNFELNNTAGWQNHQGIVFAPAPVNSNVLELAHNAFTYKTYNFSVASSGAAVTIDFDFYAVGKWEATDTLYIYFNGAYQYIGGIPGTDGNTQVVSKHFSFPATLDANGQIILYLYVGSNKASEKGYIDNINLNTGKDPSYRDFGLRYQQTFNGDIYTIGNTILVTPKTQKSTICNTYTDGLQLTPIAKSNDNYFLCAYWADTTLSFPTTTAVLPQPSAGAKVKWAGLYWQALLDGNATIPKAAMQIKLKHSALATYTTITPDVLDQKVGAAGIPGYLSYAAFADVSKYFVDNNLTSGTISVGDIPVVEGKIAQLGTYGAWSLVVIYEDANSTLKNFSVYDGWQKVDQFNTLVNIDIGGFHTPQNPTNVAASLSVFTAEGDKYIPADALQVKPSKQNAFTTLLNNFDSTIDTASARTPNPSNNQGIDIRTFELGTAGHDIILSEESNMTLQFTSSATTDADGNPAQDAYWPSLVTFAAELYAPRICYDYSASMGDQIPIPTKSTREINSSTFGGGLPLKVQFLIHSYEADFTYIHSKAYLTFTGPDAANLTHNHNYMEMSPANKNSYFKYIDPHPELEVNATLGQVALGTNVIGVPNNNGGELTAQATTYAILGYDINTTQNSIATKFDLHFDGQIIFQSGEAPVNYAFSTDANNIPRCETNATYDTLPMGLNIERTNTELEAAETKYTLTTQITGRPYSVDIVTYTSDGVKTVAAQQPLDTTVELELINADAFQNSSAAGYDTTCQNPAPIGTGKLIYLDPNNQDPVHKGRHAVTIPTDTNGFINNTQAVHNAAFRLWVLTKKDPSGKNVVMKHNCTDKSTTNTCFMDLYDAQIFADANQSKYCDVDCHDAGKTNTSCYTCLKDYYSVAICSRDNFSIRPESFHVTISDDNFKLANTPTLLADNNNATTHHLAAGYKYVLEVNTTNFGDDSLSSGYYSDRFAQQTYGFGAIPPFGNPGNIAIAEFSAVNPTPCSDRNSTSLPYHFSNGTLVGTRSYISYNNVGRYELWYSDSSWTEVDQSTSGYKPIFAGVAVDDCNLSSYSSSQGRATGCTIYSAAGSKNRILTQIKPYAFDLSALALVKYPNTARNIMYLNDLNNSTNYANYNPANPIIDMAISIEGKITARGADNYRLTNFTDNCVAQPLTLQLIHTSNPAEQILTDSNGNLVQFQQFLQQTLTTNPWSDTQVGADKNVTLTKDLVNTVAAFPEGVGSTPGKATIYLNTTYKKPLNSTVNPFVVTYKQLYAKGAASLSYDANMTTGNIPDGNSSYADTNITYYFAKVTPLRTTYANVSANYKQTPLYVDIFCDNGTCASFDLNQTTQSPDELTTWYDASNIFDNANDGTTNLVVTDVNGTVNPTNTILFNSGAASQTDINVTLNAGTPRPHTITVEIQPVPWLRYDSSNAFGYPSYKVEFSDAGWAGVGNTGSVVETGSSKESSQRTNW